MSGEQNQAKQKPGPKPAADKQVELLQRRIERLEACLAKIAHYSGSQRIIDEFGIDRWEISKADMSKYQS